MNNRACSAGTSDTFLPNVVSPYSTVDQVLRLEPEASLPNCAFKVLSVEIGDIASIVDLDAITGDRLTEGQLVALLKGRRLTIIRPETYAKQF